MAFLKGGGKAVVGENIRTMRNTGMGEADAVKFSMRKAKLTPKPKKVKGIITPPEFDPSEAC